MTTDPDTAGPDLRRLILDAKGTRSFESMSKDCGGNPTGKRLQQMTASDLKAFPDPSSIKGMARGFGVSQQDVLLACARSLGLNVSGGVARGALVLSDIDELDESARQALVDTARQMVRLARRDRAVVEATVGALTTQSDAERSMFARQLGHLDPDFARALSRALRVVSAASVGQEPTKVRTSDVIDLVGSPDFDGMEEVRSSNLLCSTETKTAPDLRKCRSGAFHSVRGQAGRAAARASLVRHDVRGLSHVAVRLVP